MPIGTQRLPGASANKQELSLGHKPSAEALALHQERLAHFREGQLELELELMRSRCLELEEAGFVASRALIRDRILESWPKARGGVIEKLLEEMLSLAPRILRLAGGGELEHKEHALAEKAATLLEGFQEAALERGAPDALSREAMSRVFVERLIVPTLMVPVHHVIASQKTLLWGIACLVQLFPLLCFAGAEALRVRMAKAPEAESPVGEVRAQLAGEALASEEAGAPSGEERAPPEPE